MFAAAVVALVPVPGTWIETAYSRGVYAAVQPLATFVSNATAFAWIDALGAVVLVCLAVLLVSDARRYGVAATITRSAWRACVWAAIFYLWFAAAWGLNYRRQPLRDRLAFNASAVTPAEALRLAAVAVDRVNRLHDTAHAEGWVSPATIDPALAGALSGVARDLGAAPRDVVVGRPKRTLVDWYFRRAGVSGMTDPFFLETLVATDLLPFERPLVVAHEWAHLAGLADEGEANVAGWLACTRGSTADQYSGWLFMYGEAIAAVGPGDRAATSAQLAAGPRGDLRAIRERTIAQVSPRVSNAGWRVYDSYLKANRVAAGTASYSEVVRLALGLEIARRARAGG